MNYKKLFIGLVVVAMAFSVTVAGAQTLTADQIIAALMANPTLITQLSGLLGGSTSAAIVTSAPLAPLTIGSSGTQVTALQNFLIGQGYQIPAGATGYFGTQTQAAVKAYQVNKNILPSVGYYGNLTAASVAEVIVSAGGSSGSTLPAGCTSTTGYSSTTGQACSTTTTLPAGCTSTTGYSPTTGNKCDGSTTTGGGVITTPGAEGSITVTVNPTPGSGQTVREGDLKKAILGLKLEAKLSDIAVQRVKIDLGSSTIVYNKLFDKIYVMDGSTVVAESALNSSTVVKDGTTYYITLTGFNVIVSKDTTKVLTLAVDAKSSIDSTYDAVATYGLAIPIDGVRGVDGAGLTESGPATAISRRTVTIDSDALLDSASLVISYNNSSPTAAQVIADQNSDGDEYDELPLLVFNLKGEKDDVKITELIAGVTRGVGTVATATTAYLYEAGNTEAVGTATVESTSATAGTATFSNFDYIVPKDTTKVLTLKVDIRDADTTGTTFIGSVTAGTDVDVENTSGTAITETGTATGNTQTILDSGIEASLVGTPTLTCTGCAQSNDNLTLSTSTLTAIFNVKVKAVGAAIVLPAAASNTPMFSKTGATNSFLVYVDSVAATLNSGTSTDYTIPSTCSTSGLTNGCTLSEGSEVIIPVTYTFPGRTAAGVVNASGNHTVQLKKINYGATVTTSTFMASENAWRTNPIYAP